MVMRRREFIVGVGTAAAVWPLGASAQQPDRLRRVGVILGLAESDPEGQARIGAFQQALQQLGWTEGHNIALRMATLRSLVSTPPNWSRLRLTLF